jgi:RNA polymerase sigma factor (sigma-70 family)
VAEDQHLKELPDHELLRQFSKRRDGAAFSALLQRYGSMVLNVCQNVLRNEHDAEDAFQATFLILAQKAGTIQKKSSAGSWLYGVAYRTAIKAQARSTQRQLHEARLRSRTATVPADDLGWREVEQLLHEELNRLSDRYRAPLVYCYLEGKTQHQAAQLLGVSKTTLQRRLESGRALLRARLVRRGLSPAVVLMASAWPACTAQASAGPLLLNSTMKAATLLAAGHIENSGVISPRVLALVEGVLKAMFWTKLKLVSALVLAILVGAGVGGWSYKVTAAQRQPSAQPQQPVQGERPARRAERPLADELDALRLEIDALRKEVRVTQDRVKALELRGRTQQGLNQIQRGAPDLHNKNNWPVILDQQIPQIPTDLVGPFNLAVPEDKARLGSERLDNAFAEAEAALKKLRQNPGDKQAAQALEKATKRLKARTEETASPKH